MLRGFFKNFSFSFILTYSNIKAIVYKNNKIINMKQKIYGPPAESIYCAYIILILAQDMRPTFTVHDLHICENQHDGEVDSDGGVEVTLVEEHCGVT